MEDKKKLLELRRKLKAKKPDFLYQDTHRVIALPHKWRKPRGFQSKMRLNKQGHRGKVQVGWKSPALVRGYHPSGYLPIVVNTVSDLDLLDKTEHGVILSSTLGEKKRCAVIEQAIKKGIQVLNVKDAKKYLEESKKRFEQKKSEKQKKASEKAAKKKEIEAKKKDREKKPKEALPQEYSAEDKIKAEKKEKDKILASGN